MGLVMRCFLPATCYLFLKQLTPLEAETLIVNGITAWQMLHIKARIKRGQTILVHGANGGVGTILTQLALYAGVRVIGTASPRHHETLRAQACSQ